LNQTFIHNPLIVVICFLAKLKIDSSLSCIQAAQEDDFDPRDATIRQLGKVLKSKSATIINENNDKSGSRKERDRKKAREDEKLEKRRLKEEERQRRMTEKKKKKQSKNSSLQNGPTLEDFVQSEDNPVPLFVEKCILFIEEEGLDSEGIYRVPGNRAHVDLLFQKFEEGINSCHLIFILLREIYSFFPIFDRPECIHKGTRHSRECSGHCFERFFLQAFASFDSIRNDGRIDRSLCL